jgi:hypothetical protein
MKTISKQDRKFVLALQQELNRNKIRAARPKKAMKDRENSDPSEGEEEDGETLNPTEKEVVQLLLSLQHSSV